MLGVMIEAIRNVSRKPVWNEMRPAWQDAERPAIRPIDVLPVEPRHSGFAGLSNDRDFQLTA